jgi:hypothetical protein
VDIFWTDEEFFLLLLLFLFGMWVRDAGQALLAESHGEALCRSVPTVEVVTTRQILVVVFALLCEIT